MKATGNNIVELFWDAASQYPENTAIIEKEQSISYRHLRQEVKYTAAYFSQKGIASGDRVLVFVPMGIDLYRIVLALFYLGATAVFLDEWVSKKRLERCCQLADCKGFIGTFKARLFAFFSKELRQIPIVLGLRKQLKQNIPMARVSPDAPALLTFTTGSTGTPKAAKRSHSFLKAQFDALLEEIQPQVSDTDMPVLPIVLFVNLGVGCTSVIADFKMTRPEAMKAAWIVAQIKKRAVNRITASPFFIQKLAEYSIAKNDPLVGIKKIFTGGAPVFPAKAALYASAFPEARSTIVYGSTEAEPISSIDARELAAHDQDWKDGLPVGKPFHRTQVKILKITTAEIPSCPKEAFAEMEVADGAIGEIVVSGSHVLKQYFRNETAFRQNKIVVENTIWHRTGDGGFIKNGELFLTGRCQQLIPLKGQLLSPFIIENRLQGIEGVQAGTLIKAADQLVLVVETKLTKDQIEARTKDILYDRICLIPKMPMDPRHHSKIDYGSLTEWIKIEKG